VGPRTGLDTGARGKIVCPCRGSNLDRPVVQPVEKKVVKVKQSLYTPWRRLGGEEI
jgi:hypothetical protein